MQSTSPSSVPGPKAEVAVWFMVTVQVPLTLSSTGSLPCQAPAQTPERSGGTGGAGSSPPPPPQAVNRATRQTAGNWAGRGSGCRAITPPPEDVGYARASY